MSGEYFLGKSEWAATRLRLQHELTKINLDGHVLELNTQLLGPGSVVADIGCGTGTWLLDLVDLFPGIVAEGLDINLDNTPPKPWLPEGVSFFPFDVLKAVPDEFLERYDFINAQFISSFVRDAHIDQFISAVKKMLSRLRADLMLRELENQAVTSKSPRPTTLAGKTGDRRPPQIVKFYELVGDIFGGYNQWKWLEAVEETFMEAEFEEIQCRRPQAKPSTLQGNMMNILLAQSEAGELIAAHPVLSTRALEHKEAREKAAKEAREFCVGLDLAVTRCWGRKPL